MLRVALVSMVMVCGSGAAGAGDHRLCQIVAVLPSSTLPARPLTREVSASLAVAVHPVARQHPRRGCRLPGEQVDLGGAAPRAAVARLGPRGQPDVAGVDRGEGHRLLGGGVRHGSG